MPIIFALLFAALFLAALPVLAQDSAVTDDEVNAIAGQLYCPVCENIPLDTCGTPACIQWRGEIRTQLEAGRTPQQVIDDFVARFGDRVVGTPQDPALRALSLVTPVLLAGVALVVGLATLLRWRRRTAQAMVAAVPRDGPSATDDDYRARLEADVKVWR